MIQDVLWVTPVYSKTVESLETIKRDPSALNMMRGRNLLLTPAGSRSLALAKMVKSPLKTILEILKTLRVTQTRSRLVTSQDLALAEDPALVIWKNADPAQVKEYPKTRQRPGAKDEFLRDRKSGIHTEDGRYPRPNA